MFPPQDQQHLRDEEKEGSSNPHQIPPSLLTAPPIWSIFLPTNSGSQKTVWGFSSWEGRVTKCVLRGFFFLLCHSNKGDFLVSVYLPHLKVSVSQKKTWISSSKWNHFKTWPRIRTEMHVTGLGGTAKKWQKLSIFANSLQFSSTGQCTSIPASVRGTIPAHTNTPCSHQRMDKQGLFLPCNKSGIGKLSTGLRKADKREWETKHLLHIEKTRHL